MRKAGHILMVGILAVTWLQFLAFVEFIWLVSAAHSTSEAAGCRDCSCLLVFAHLAPDHCGHRKIASGTKESIGRMIGFALPHNLCLQQTSLALRC
jgi:hypothetical protein